MTDEHEAFRTMVRAYIENEIGAGTYSPLMSLRDGPLGPG
jgi:hypothetical protein